MQQLCVIVLGCYRSGTSAVAGVLHNLGVYMGGQFDQPNENNQYGFWEDIEFKKFHDDMFHGKLEDLNDYISLIRNREEKNIIWGIKDPYLCTFLPTFSKHVKIAKKLIICRRSAEDISKSMNKAITGQEDSERFLPLAEHYLEELDRSANSYTGPVLEIWYDNLISDPEKCVKNIADFVGLPVNDEAVSHIKRK